MKKILALLLAMVMIFALAACGGDDSNDGGNGGNGGGSQQGDDAYVQALSDFLQGYYGFDDAKLDAAAPAGFLDEMFQEEVKRVADLNYEDKSYEVGGDFTISLKETTKNELSGDAKAALIAVFGNYGIAAEDVLALTANVEYNVGGTAQAQTEEYKMVKVGGKWYVAEWIEYEGAYYEATYKVSMMISG